MGYKFSPPSLNALLKDLSEDYLIFAPKRFEGQAPYSDLDSIRYGEIERIEEAELEQKSHYSMKEVFFPISETLFYFTENTVTESELRIKKMLWSFYVHATYIASSAWTPFILKTSSPIPITSDFAKR